VKQFEAAFMEAMLGNSVKLGDEKGPAKQRAKEAEVVSWTIGVFGLCWLTQLRL
jgi:hypothetical protein